MREGIGLAGSSAIAGGAYYFNKRAKMKMEVEDFIPDQSLGFYGPEDAIRATKCRAYTGKRKRESIKKLVSWMLREKVFRYQSLVGNSATSSFRGGGSFNLTNIYITGTDNTYPQSIDYPIYIFRCSVPNGQQMDFPNVGSRTAIAPIIGYRLQSFRLNANTPNSYRWVTIVPQQNVNFQQPPLNHLNIQACIDQDEPGEFSSNRIRHDYTTVAVHYTAPTALQCPLITGFVRFTRDEYCPPDEYVSVSDTPPYSVINSTRANAGSYNISVPVPTDGVDQMEYTAFWDRYITLREGHPLRRHLTFDNVPREVFKFERRPFVRTFGLASTDVAGAPLGHGRIQHTHVDTLRSRGWKDTSISARKLHLDQNNDQANVLDNSFATYSDAEMVGVFPKPTDQRWFMVSAFPRLGTLVMGTPSTATLTPSFDISLTQKYSVFMPNSA